MAKNLEKPTVNALSDNYKNERKLNFLEKLYLPEILKGMWYSFKQMFQPSFTLNYPEEKWDPPAIFRGRPVLVEDHNKERCVACGLCARACPPLAISMQAKETEDEKERYPDFFEINMLRCIYCGYCEEVCPEEAIVMSKDYDIVFESREDAIYDKERLLVPKEDVADRLEYLKNYRNRQFGSFWDFQEENNIHSVRDRDKDWNTGLSLVDMIEQQEKNDSTPASSSWNT
ncbi:MAG: NADH-quinone oxidoreductase subunit I [Gracilimonas sp.]|uniref:NADH-quinone oxidoreductase subunit I n=1 Tax=Gracilimonas sediminicola TaxID=2952158 RepID=A0A9X2L5I6_9BACT|nr:MULTISPECIES: NADH-quinone oxidoreductase subunit I [Gracilimonas]MBO6586418.1 NADH-quinone oxidoreductase subunit I [Gracilimonas sp.]MBO6615075.1 NADH-quinone oxidoreductase subunit I [Gracilimonas sp.]MCP9292748.1 NADH-quinone oxidoreductase subunit I [Gracilimonas sediminicola]